MSTVMCRAKHANTAWTGFIKVSEENAIIRDSGFCTDRKVIVVIVDDTVEKGASFLPSQCLLSVLVEADLGDHHSAPPHGEYRPPQAQHTPHCDWTHCLCVRWRVKVALNCFNYLIIFCPLNYGAFPFFWSRDISAIPNTASHLTNTFEHSRLEVDVQSCN